MGPVLSASSLVWPDCEQFLVIDPALKRLGKSCLQMHLRICHPSSFCSDLLAAEAVEEKEEGELSEAEAMEEKQSRDRARQKHVAEAMNGDFMEDWISLANWKAAKTVIPPQKAAE